MASSEYRGKVIEGKNRIEQEYAPFLSDEARISPAAPDLLYFPETSGEAAEAVLACRKERKKCTLSGGRTGIGGGAVPSERTKAVISLERIQPPVSIEWNREHDTWSARVGAGMRLQDLLTALQKKQYRSSEEVPDGLFFPVDPTETSASLGGMAATNASGARTLYYGAMRKWVLGLTVVLADGSILRLKRNENISRDGSISLKTKTGTIALPIRPVEIPPTKHTAGYFLQENTDLVDLFIGSEGTLGIVTELEIALTLPGKHNMYTVVFLREDKPESAVRGLLEARELPPVALEYMDKASLSLLRQFRTEQGDASGVPDLPRDVQAVLYLEYNFKTETELKEGAFALSDLLKSAALSPESTWTGFSARTLTAMKAFRHALPERINSIVAGRKQSIPDLTKIGTDMAVPFDSLKGMLEEYRQTISKEGLEFYIFGHIGNGHVHVNMLPRNRDEMEKGWALYTELARSVKSKGGSICAEHGIGRLKKKLLPIQFTKREIEDMKNVKNVLDPENRLNPDVLFPEQQFED